MILYYLFNTLFYCFLFTLYAYIKELNITSLYAKPNSENSCSLPSMAFLYIDSTLHSCHYYMLICFILFPVFILKSHHLRPFPFLFHFFINQRLIPTNTTTRIARHSPITTDNLIRKSIHSHTPLAQPHRRFLVRDQNPK